MSLQDLCPKNKSKNYPDDIISSLPEEILSHILSFLPTVDAVGTSFLSTKWKNIWTSLSTLAFDDCHAPFHCRGELPEELSENVKFAKFVNGVLHSHGENPLVSFYMYCESYSRVRDIRRWISISITKGVRELGLSVMGGKRVKLPQCFFNSATLEVIKLQGFIVIKVPTAVYLPNLRTMELCDVEYVDVESARKLISCCTSLDYLDIQIFEYEAIVDPHIISSSTLRLLSYTTSETIEFMTILEEGIEIKSSDSDRCCLCCKTLEELHLTGVTIRSTFCFPNLLALKLDQVIFDGDVSVNEIISSIPSLEILVIIDPDDTLVLNSKLQISSSTLRYLSIQKSHDGLVLVLDAPALRFLNLGSFVLESIHIKHLSSLVNASINLFIRQNVHDILCNNAMGILFHGLYNVRILTLSRQCMMGTIPDHQFPKFPKLAVLRVGIECCTWPLLVQFISNSEALEDLILLSEKANYEETDSGRILSWNDPKIVPECLLSSFIRLSFYGFVGYQNELAMVEYLLKNSILMQRMVIEIHPLLDNEIKIDLLQKLLTFRRGSNECEMSVRSNGSMSIFRERLERCFSLDF